MQTAITLQMSLIRLIPLGGLLVLSVLVTCTHTQAAPRQGLELRGALGYSWVNDSVQSERIYVYTADLGRIEGTATGSGFAGELSLGGAVSDSWSLGVLGVYSHAGSPTASEITWGNFGQSRDVEFDGLSVGLLGPYAETFQSDGPFYLQLSPGIAFAHLGSSTRQVANTDPVGGAGVGLSLAPGAEWPVAPGLHLGAQARFTGAVVWGESSDANHTKWTQSLFVPSLMLTGRFGK